jgi:hypothetical protein
MKTNLIKKMTAVIIIASLSVVLKSHIECPPGVVPTCPFPDPVFTVFFPHPNDCEFFFRCENGVAYCEKCPAGLHWNTVFDTCDYPETAGCDKEITCVTCCPPSTDCMKQSWGIRCLAAPPLYSARFTVKTCPPGM